MVMQWECKFSTHLIISLVLKLKILFKKLVYKDVVINGAINLSALHML